MTRQQLITKKELIHQQLKAELMLQKHIIDQIRYLNGRANELEESINKNWDKMQILAEEIEGLFIKNEIEKSKPS